MKEQIGTQRYIKYFPGGVKQEIVIPLYGKESIEATPDKDFIKCEYCGLNVEWLDLKNHIDLEHRK